MKKILLPIYILLVCCAAAGCSGTEMIVNSPAAAEVITPILNESVLLLPEPAFPVATLSEEQKAKRLPVKIEIPSFEISASIQPVGQDNEGRVDTIPDALVIGWYKYGASPGAQGNAILDGHRDWKGKLGSFRDIERLKLDEAVKIEFEDGSAEEFKVISNRTYPMDEVPASVMQLKGESRITLITCAGKFIKEKGGYQNRVVVILKK